ncbi:hypothetical protein [Burkholderia cepacia]|uniref:hypothetical protein n=1 Tax=Burkholderia cepacia TaxID=292 RepID=UPI002AB6D3B5|nr:hypothetical protein [Burkholderia cepacia]
MSGTWVFHEGPDNPKRRFVVEYERRAPENATIEALIVRIPSRKRNAIMLEILRIAAETIARDPLLERRLGLAPNGPPSVAAPASHPVDATVAPPAASVAHVLPSAPPAAAPTIAPAPPAPVADAPVLSPEPPSTGATFSAAALSLLRHGEED